MTVDDLTRPLYHELAAAGLVRTVNTFAGGTKSAHWLTEEGFQRKAELLACAKESA
jgi:hypothetical protein